jgi:predicted dienelactone hydrolase
MRRLLLAAALLVSAAACSSDDSGASTPTSDAATTQPAATAPPATEPAATEPPPTEPPATEPPATEPSATEPATTEPPATEPPATDASIEFTPIEAGPYQVGVTTITVNDAARNRPLTVDVWFPLADATEGAAHQYTPIPGVYYESPDAISAQAASMSPDGPFPLVVYSHGSGGLRYIHSSYTEAIASHGYVVVAPDHTGNTAVDRLANAETEFDVTALNRPNDVKAVIDAMLDPALPETAGFVASVDPERIAVTGHSFGGFTTYAMVSGYTNGLGTFAPDPRVDAIIPLAPATGDGNRLLTDADLAKVTVPALVMVGTNDQTTPVDPNVTRPWELTASSPHIRVDFIDGQHQTFTDICDYQEFVPTLPDVPQVILDTIESYGEQGCSPGDMPTDRAKELTNTFAVQFLESVFRAGPPIDATTRFPDDVTVMIKP